MKRAICHYGDPVLRRKCATVKEITPELRTLARDLLETMYAAPGVGLAANQVGVPVRLCVVDVMPKGKRQPLVLINPVVTSGEGVLDDEEGCLSFPGLVATVKRRDKVRVTAINEMGLPIIVDADGWLSRALQHEIDHLNGTVFIDHVSSKERKLIDKVIAARKKQGTW